MTMTNPAYRGEAILLRWGESSANGRTVTFQIGDGPDDTERHQFYGMKTGRDHGQRFALVAVPLEENENDSAAVLTSPPCSNQALPADGAALTPRPVSEAAARPADMLRARAAELSGTRNHYDATAAVELEAMAERIDSTVVAVQASEPPEAGSGAAGRPAMTEGERLVQQAGILCGDERFQQWAENEVIRKNLTMTGVMVGNLQETAAWFVRWYCRIASRRELATNEAAAEKFRALVARYRQETGQAAWEKPR